MVSSNETVLARYKVWEQIQIGKDKLEVPCLQVMLQVLLGAQGRRFEPFQGSLRLSPTAFKLNCFHVPILLVVPSIIVSVAD